MLSFGPISDAPISDISGPVNVALTGAAITVAAGSVSYSGTVTLSGGMIGTTAGMLAAEGGDVVSALRGELITVLPGNVKVTGGTRWYAPVAPRTETLAITAGNTLPPPPRATGNVQADLIALQQWAATFYDQFVKAHNVFGQLTSIKARLTKLEEK